jgi:hydrogenase-4 component F
MGLFLLAVPVIAVLLFAISKDRRLMHTVSVAASSLMLLLAAVMTRDVLQSGAAAYPALGGIFYVDALSIILLDIVLLVGFMASVFSIQYMEEEIKQGKLAAGRLKIYYILMYSFICTMILALTVKNMGIMWFAIEATTLASVFLVGLNNDKHALEAAWKYIIICSVGIAIALLGIILLHLSSIGVLKSSQFLDWTALYSSAGSLKSATCRLAFIFILIGFGTKAGLAPMHTWLPDAHSQAPSPISALLSGVLLNSALYGIIRTVAVVNRNLGSSVFTGRILIAIGILSIVTAAIFILTQKDYKRLLAYSSIEHMGIITVAIGIFTPLSVFAALFHMINHSLTKSMLFLSSGSVLQKYDTKQILKIKGIVKLLPVTGTVFLLGLIAIAGTPPFSVFSSELAVMAAIFQGGSFWLGAVVILLLAVVFAGIALTMFKMFFGQPPKDLVPGETNIPGAVCLSVFLIAVVAGGVFMPDAVKDLINSARSIIIGG